MSQTTNPFRRTAGHLSALVKGFVAARDIMQKDGSIGIALEIVNEQNALCKTYLKSNDCAKDAREDRSREQNLLDPFLLCEQIHDQVCDGLDEFIHGGTKLVTSHTLFLRRDKTSSRCNRR